MESSSLTTASTRCYGLEQLAEIFNAGFAGYSAPVQVDAAGLAQRTCREQLDWDLSRVILSRGEPIGIGILGVRGSRFWCGGFGLVPEWRGRGAATQLWRAMLEGVSGELTLEVLQSNGAALSFYLRQGMSHRRDLLLLEIEAVGPGLPEVDPVEVLRHFQRLHPLPPVWQRDLPALLATRGLRALAFGAPDAYALILGDRLVDIGADSAESAKELCRRLRGRYRLNNEPEGSFFQPHFHEVGRQHELVIGP